MTDRVALIYNGRSQREGNKGKLTTHLPMSHRMPKESIT